MNENMIVYTEASSIDAEILIDTGHPLDLGEAIVVIEETITQYKDNKA